jgi:hypothetical protein
MDGRIIFHDNLNSHFFLPNDEPQIIDHQIMFGGPDPYSKIVSGWIKIQARTTPLKRLSSRS